MDSITKTFPFVMRALIRKERLGIDALLRYLRGAKPPPHIANKRNRPAQHEFGCIRILGERQHSFCGHAPFLEPGGDIRLAGNKMLNANVRIARFERRELFREYPVVAGSTPLTKQNVSLRFFRKIVPYKTPKRGHADTNCKHNKRRILFLTVEKAVRVRTDERVSRLHRAETL